MRSASGTKIEFLGEALALLFPIDWPEPFGLVHDRSHGVRHAGHRLPARVGSRNHRGRRDRLRGGRIEDDALAAAQKIHRARPRTECRRVFEQRFTAERMAENYLQVYRRLAETAQRRSALPEPGPDERDDSHRGPLVHPGDVLAHRCSDPRPEARGDVSRYSIASATSSPIERRRARASITRAPVSCRSFELTGRRPAADVCSARASGRITACSRSTSPRRICTSGTHYRARRARCTSSAPCFCGRPRATSTFASSNYSQEPIALAVSLEFDADYADIFEVRGFAASAARTGPAAGGHRRPRAFLAIKGSMGRRAALASSCRPAPTIVASDRVRV